MSWNCFRNHDTVLVRQGSGTELHFNHRIDEYLCVTCEVTFGKALDYSQDLGDRMYDIKEGVFLEPEPWEDADAFATPEDSWIYEE